MKKQFVLLLVTAVFLLAWSAASIVAQSATPEETTWTAHYWNNVDLSGSPDLTRAETGPINHRWGFDSPDPAINPDRFSARWTTSVELEAGLYRFTTVSDDGVRVWVGGELLIDNWTVHAEETDVATRSLVDGSYEIVVEYFENTGVATIFFSWERVDEIVDCRPSYVVQPGDWLSRIARQCGVSVERILAANPHIADPHDIRVGQELTIPSPDVSATTHFNLNFRPVPTVNSTPFGVIPAGTTVAVNGRNLAADWLFVTYQGQQGWIAGWLTDIEGDLADVPLIPVEDPAATPPRDQEAIVIEEPGPGSRVTSPLRVSGIADPAQHQTIVARLLLEDGTVLFEQPVQIDAPLGERGPYEAVVPFSVSGERQAFVQMLSRSARDGRIVHLSSAGIVIADSGPEEITTRDPQPARVTIHQPAANSTVSGGVATISGFGLASFEQTLLVEIHDGEGNVVGSEPVLVDAPNLGQPGSFSIDLPYNVAAAGPGRVAVRDISPAFGGDAYVTSVEITLQP